MQSRRDVITAGALSIFFCGVNACCGAERGARHSMGCQLAQQDIDAIFPESSRAELSARFRANSGDRDFDGALAQTLARLVDVFGVLPGFAYYDDDTGHNAFATDRTLLGRNDGSVLFGLGLFRELRGLQDAPEVAVAGVCSHEFGHILQFRHKLFRVDDGQDSVMRSELQADYFAGYFAGIRRRESPRYPAAVVALTLHNLGDNTFWSPNHHGTKSERGSAAALGFDASFYRKIGLSDAIEESTNYVLGIEVRQRDKA
jgi:hypothetical protein